MNLHSTETSVFYTSYLRMDHHDNLKSLITTFIVHWFQHLQNITTGKNVNTGKLFNAEAIGINTIKAFLLINPGLRKSFIIRRHNDYLQNFTPIWEASFWQSHITYFKTQYFTLRYASSASLNIFKWLNVRPTLMCAPISSCWTLQIRQLL